MEDEKMMMSKEKERKMGRNRGNVWEDWMKDDSF